MRWVSTTLSFLYENLSLIYEKTFRFIKTMREHTEIFSNESINTIFSNIEKLWSFQQTFLQALKQSVPNNRIGEVFLEYVSP